MDIDEVGSDSPMLEFSPFDEDALPASCLAHQEWQVSEDPLVFGNDLALPFADPCLGSVSSIAECSPQSLLPQALRWGSPQVYFRVDGSRKRASKKGVDKRDLANALHNLLLNPSSPVRVIGIEIGIEIEIEVARD